MIESPRAGAPAARFLFSVRLALLAALVVGVSAAAFLPTLSAGFVNWDDDVNFTTNVGFRGLAATLEEARRPEPLVEALDAHCVLP